MPNRRMLCLILPLVLSPCLAAQPNTGLLAGPRVEDNAPPELRETMGGNAGAMGQLRLNDAQYRALFESLRADDAPESVRPSGGQLETIEAMLASHKSEREAYFREHRQELSGLRRDAGERRGRRDGQRRPTSDEPTPTDEMSGEDDRQKQDVARARLREIRAGAPTTAGLFREMWEVLAPAQRTYLEGRLDTMRAERNAAREAEYIRRRVGEAPSNAGSGPERDADTMRGRSGLVTAADRRARLLALFEKLTPEQQEVLLSRLEGRVRGATSANTRTESGVRSSRRRPSVEDVRVPDPEAP